MFSASSWRSAARTVGILIECRAAKLRTELSLWPGPIAPPRIEDLNVSASSPDLVCTLHLSNKDGIVRYGRNDVIIIQHVGDVAAVICSMIDDVDENIGGAHFPALTIQESKSDDLVQIDIHQRVQKPNV